MEMGDDDMEIRGIEHGNLSWPLLMAISLCLLFFSFSYHPVVPLLWFPQIFIPLPLDVSAGCFLLLCFFFFFFGVALLLHERLGKPGRVVCGRVSE